MRVSHLVSPTCRRPPPQPLAALQRSLQNLSLQSLYSLQSEDHLLTLPLQTYPAHPVDPHRPAGMAAVPIGPSRQPRYGRELGRAQAAIACRPRHRRRRRRRCHNPALSAIPHRAHQPPYPRRPAAVAPRAIGPNRRHDLRVCAHTFRQQPAERRHRRTATPGSCRRPLASVLFTAAVLDTEAHEPCHKVGRGAPIPHH